MSYFLRHSAFFFYLLCNGTDMIVDQKSSLACTPQGSGLHGLDGGLLLWCRYREVKGGALIGFACSPDFTVVQGDDSLYNGQPHTCTFKFADGMQSLKDTEKLIVVGHIKTGAVVFYIISSGVGCDTNLYFRLLFLR